MARFLHTADLHLNAQRRRFPHYLLRAEWALDAVAETAVSHQCDCIVIAGDVFDQPNLTIAERQLLSEWLGRLQIPVLMISGNHDARSKLIGDTCLSYLSALDLQLHLVHDGDPKIVRAFDCTFLLFPYHGWPHHEFKLLVDAMVERVREKRPDETIIGVAHEAVVGATTDNGITITKKEQIKLLADKSVDYWALGDIHAGQEVVAGAYYCGSPYQVDFGEDRNKGVVVVDTDDIGSPQLVELECPYPLEVLTEPPDEWPLFFIYRGVPPRDMPDHGVVEMPAAVRPIEIDTSQSRVPLLHRLREVLIEQQHPEELLDSTIEMAVQMAEDLELEL